MDLNLVDGIENLSGIQWTIARWLGGLYRRLPCRQKTAYLAPSGKHEALTLVLANVEIIIISNMLTFAELKSACIWKATVNKVHILYIVRYNTRMMLLTSHRQTQIFLT